MTIFKNLFLSLLHAALNKKLPYICIYFFTDIRKTTQVMGRSINLALSHRGRKALCEIGLEEKILESGVPMYGRLLHTVEGKQTSVPYDAIGKNVS